MLQVQARTMSELHTKLCQRIITASATELDVMTSVDVAMHDVVAVADSMEYNFDLKSIWVGKARWNMMVRQYLDPADVVEWMYRSVDLIGAKGRGQTVLRTKLVKSRGGAANGSTNKETRKWGSCMLSLSYRARPQPTITLHSRTSYLGYLSALDFNIAHTLARYLAPKLGLKVEDFKFVWMVESVQWHGFKSLPWAICNTDPTLRKRYRKTLLTKLDSLEGEYLELANTPAMQINRKWINYVRREDQAGNSYGETNYNTYRRIRRRWHTEVFGYEKGQEFEGWSYYRKGDKEGERREFFKAYNPLPSVWTEDCDLSAIKLPFGQSQRRVEPIGELVLDDFECFTCGEVDGDE